MDAIPAIRCGVMDGDVALFKSDAPDKQAADELVKKALPGLPRPRRKAHGTGCTCKVTRPSNRKRAERYSAETQSSETHREGELQCESICC